MRPDSQRDDSVKRRTHGWRRACTTVAAVLCALVASVETADSQVAPAPSAQEPVAGTGAPAPTVAAAAAPTLRPGVEARELEVGDVLVGWTLTAIDHHPEFLRYTFEGGEGTTPTTVVEVTYARGEGSPFETTSYLVQAAPSQSPPEALVEEVWQRVGALDREGSDALVRQTGSGFAGAEEGDGQVGSTRSYTLIILGVLGALVLIRIALRVRDSARKRREGEGSGAGRTTAQVAEAPEDAKEADAKEADATETDATETDARETDARETDARETDARESDAT